MMLVLVSYDVSFEDQGGKHRLRRIARICENFGQRVQYSVFECVVDPAQWAVLRHQLLEAFNEDRDSLRFYFLGKNWQRRIEHHGTKSGYDPEEDTLII
jgi:CRISPR-associated protein Cas2